MKRIALIFILLVSFFLFKTEASEAAGEKISSFSANYQILPDATLKITEIITYDFRQNHKHGIFREIPLVMTNQEGKKFRLKVENISVSYNNYNNYKNYNFYNDLLTIKIGDPNVLVTGVKTYEINYQVIGGLRYFSDHDELYWNVTGNNWDVPVEKANVSVELPTDVLVNKVTCFTGAIGSTDSNCNATFEQNLASFSTENLNPKEGLTIVVSFPKNLIAVVEPEEEKSGGLMENLFLGVISFLSLFWYLLLPFYIIFHWFKSGRDPKVSSNVAVTYDPPKDQKGKALHPAEVGTLVDENADNRDLSATIVDLAIKGFLKIRKEKGDNYTFIKLKDFNKDATLKNYEKDLLTGIFDEGKEVKTDDLKETFSITANRIKDLLYKNLTKAGFFAQNPKDTRNKYYALAGLAFFTANFFLGIISFIFGRQMPKKTLFGTQAKMMALGMKKFLVTQERQLEFQAKNWLFFEKLLPYAIVFGCEKIWAERFKDLQVAPPDWYEGTPGNTFNSVIFASSLSNSLSSLNSLSLSPTTSSSGFSSGFSGGSSGGGGGGGGGGSW